MQILILLEKLIKKEIKKRIRKKLKFKKITILLKKDIRIKNLILK